MTYNVLSGTLSLHTTTTMCEIYELYELCYSNVMYIDYSNNNTLAVTVLYQCDISDVIIVFLAYYYYILCV